MFWLIAAALVAQTATAAPQQTTSSDRRDANDQKITISGCVERADEMRTADVGTTTDSLHFVLVDRPTSAERAVGTSGTATDKGYRLDADVKTLNPHVGHTVEVVGFVEAPAATTGAATAVTGPLVKVESIRMLSETCGR
jgi:hypothetical protein